jgi:DHA1 family bicyclomycin/chloramphenicol resistance-like MFS transporter
MGRADNDPVLGAIALGCGALVLAVWFILQKREIGTA